MAANDEILGVSAHMDISDIQRSIDSLINGLDAIGVKTDVLSRRMNDAMNEIARSTDDSATKQKRAMDVLAQGMAEVKTAMTNYPDALRQAKNEADATAQATARLESQLAKMKTQFDATNVGSKTFEELKTSIAGVEQQIISNNQAHEAQLATIQQMEAGYNSLVQLYGVADAAVLANASAHALTTAATTAEAVAHTKNTEEIEKENQSITDQKDVIRELEETLQKASYEDTPIGSSIVTIKENLEKLREENEKLEASFKNSIGDTTELQEMDKRYQANLETIQKMEAELKNMEDIATMGFKSMEEYNESQKKTAENLNPEEVKAYWSSVRETAEQAKSYFDALPTLLERIKTLLKDINETPQNAAFLGEMQELVSQLGRATSSKDFLKNGDAERGLNNLAEKFEKLSDSEEKLIHLAQEDPWKVQGLSIAEIKQRIEETNVKIGQYEAEMDKMKSKKGFSETSKEAVELKQKIEAARKEQELLNRELEGRPGYQKFFNNLREGFKNLGQSIKNTFSQIKGGFTGGEGGISGLFQLLSSGKFLGWTAAIGAIGGTIKSLSDSAEKLKLALDPLRAYVDDNVLEKLKQSFIDTALAGSAQSTEDMSAAALQWIKYYNGIKDVPEAIMHVVDASRELASIAGISAQKAAESLTKLGGQFHLTAEEAMKSVNILVNASHNSVVNINELTQALTSSGARANQNGATLKEYAAAISLTSSQYGSASQAASAYQRILQRLSTETNDNFNPKVVGATKAFQNLKKEMDNGIDLSKKFGKLLWSQAQYFIENADNIATYTENLDDATGKQNALARAEEKAAHNKAELSNAVSALAQSIDLNLTPAFSRIVRGITNFVEWCGKAITKAGELKQQVQNWLGIKGDSKPTINWNAGDTRQKYRELLRDGSPLTASAYLISAYKSSDSKGLTLDEVRQIIREENDKWKTAHPALANSQTKGNNSEIGENNSITDPKGLQKAEQQAKLEEDLAKRRRKYQEEQKRQEVDAEIAEWELRISKMKEGYAKEEEERRLEHERRLNQIEQQKKQMLEKNIEYAAAEYDKRKKKGSKGFYALGLDQQVGLTPEQQRIYAAQIAAEEERDRAEREKRQREAHYANQKAINDALLQLGNYAEQRKAIEENTALEIEKVRSTLSEDSTEEEKNAVETQVKIIEKGGQDSLRALERKFGKLPQFLGDLFADASNKSIKELDKIVKKYEAFLKFREGGVSDEERKNLIETYGFTEDELNELIEKLNTGELSIKDFTDKIKSLRKSMEDIDRTKAFIKLLEDMENATEKGDGGKGIYLFGSTLKEVSGIADELGQSMAGLFNYDEIQYKKLVKALNDAGTMIQGLGQIIQGDYISGVINVVSGVSGWVADFLDDSDARALKESEIKSSIDAANIRIKELTEVLEKSYGEEAMKLARKKQEEIDYKQRKYVEGLRESDDYEELRYIGSEGWKYGSVYKALYEMAEQYGLNYENFIDEGFASLGSILANNPQDIAKALYEIRKNNPELWGQLTGMSDLEEYFTALADSYEEYLDTIEELNEQLTTTTEDNVFSNFMESLYELADGSEDVFNNIADNWQTMVNRMAVNNLLSENFKGKLKNWYEKLVTANREFSETHDEEAYRKALSELQTDYKSYVEEAQREIEQLRDLGIVAATGDNKNTSDQQATYNSLEKWTYDQADEIINRATAIQIINEHILEGQQSMTDAMLAVSMNMEGISGNILLISENVAVAVELHRQANDRLERIAVNTQPISEIRDIVKKIYLNR